MSRAPDFNVGAWVDECFVLIVERSMGKSKDVCGFVMLLVMFCVRCWDCLFVCGFCFGCLWWLS